MNSKLPSLVIPIEKFFTTLFKTLPKALCLLLNCDQSHKSSRNHHRYFAITCCSIDSKLSLQNHLIISLNYLSSPSSPSTSTTSQFDGEREQALAVKFEFR
jgi:hypothetical protein